MKVDAPEIVLEGQLEQQLTASLGRSRSRLGLAVALLQVQLSGELNRKKRETHESADEQRTTESGPVLVLLRPRPRKPRPGHEDDDENAPADDQPPVGSHRKKV